MGIRSWNILLPYLPWTLTVLLWSCFTPYSLLIKWHSSNLISVLYRSFKFFVEGSMWFLWINLSLVPIGVLTPQLPPPPSPPPLFFWLNHSLKCPSFNSYLWQKKKIFLFINCTPLLEKVTLSFPPTLFYKLRSCQAHPLFENLGGGSTANPIERGRGRCTIWSHSIAGLKNQSNYSSQY